ncbi:MAG: rod shape-determining protein MreC [Clostridia bacterium]|nr:rod shape-determining protein MreC [Clostridia bacterium]
MRALFRNKLFITVLILTVFFSALSVAAVVSKNRSGPVTEVVSAMTNPVRRAATAVSDFTRRLFSGISENDSLREENEKLRAEVAELEAELRELEHMEDENAAMRDLLGIVSEDQTYTLAMGEIIGRSGASWSRVFTADVGTSSGISVYDAVITAEGLVGYVSSVDLTSCRITTIIDTAMSCSAILSDCRQTGVCEGRYDLQKEGRLLLSLLPANAKPSVGETVQTSGLGGVFPKGLVIGEVVSTTMTEDGKSRTAIIEPKVDVDQISTVFFITDFKSDMNE